MQQRCNDPKQFNFNGAKVSRTLESITSLCSILSTEHKNWSLGKHICRNQKLTISLAAEKTKSWCDQNDPWKTDHLCDWPNTLIKVLVTVVFALVSQRDAKKTHGWRCPLESRWDFSARTKTTWESQSRWAEGRCCVLFQLKSKTKKLPVKLIPTSGLCVCVQHPDTLQWSQTADWAEQNKTVHLLTDAENDQKKRAFRKERLASP